MDPLKQLESQIVKFLNSHDGKIAVKKAITGLPSGLHVSNNSGGIKINENMMALAASDMKNILSSMLDNAGLGSVNNSIYLTDLKSDPERGLFFEILVPDHELQRDSLYPEKYPEGAYNIITLFEKGWKAEKSVFGVWHGEHVYSRKSRSPNPILEKAVTEFNSRWSSRGLSAVVSMKDE